MDSQQKLLDAVSAALREAGYKNIKVQKEEDGASIAADNAPGGAYFRVMNKAKERFPQRVTGGGPDARAVPHEVLVAPAVTGLHEHLVQNPHLAPAFGISAQAAEHLK